MFVQHLSLVISLHYLRLWKAVPWFLLCIGLCGRSLFKKSITVPRWVSDLPSSCELVCIRGTMVERQMGGAFSGATDDLQVDLLSVSSQSPRTTIPDFLSRSMTSSVTDEADFTRDDCYSGTFTIDAKSGSVYADDEAPKGLTRHMSGSFPALRRSSEPWS